MAASSGSLHESPDVLDAETVDRHRAIVSIMEEMEAVDWYDQRAEATHDPELAAVLRHNRDEEKEHAAMTLEWLRRHDDGWDHELRTYLFTEGPILDLEHADHDEGVGDRGADGSLGIGSLKETS
ncbi:MAG: ferritin [Acidimicrobiia bacterium]|nr:ferritin [Acidimicrobiia bacterium]